MQKQREDLILIFIVKIHRSKSSEDELFLPMMDIPVVTNNTNDLLSSDLLTEQIQISGFNCNCLIHSQACGRCISQKI